MLRMPIKTAKWEDIFYTHILITLNTTIFLCIDKQYYFLFMLTMIAVHYYLYNLSINETIYFKQALYYKAILKNDIEMDKT